MRWGVEERREDAFAAESAYPKGGDHAATALFFLWLMNGNATEEVLHEGYSQQSDH